MRDQFFNFETGAFLTFSYLGQFSFGRIFQLTADVSNRQRLRHAAIANRRYDRLNYIDANNTSAKSPRHGCRIVQREVTALTEIGRKKYRTQFHKASADSSLITCHDARRGETCPARQTLARSETPMSKRNSKLERSAGLLWHSSA